MDKFPILCEDKGNFWKSSLNFCLKNLEFRSPLWLNFYYYVKMKKIPGNFTKFYLEKIGIPISSMDEFPGNSDF